MASSNASGSKLAELEEKLKGLKEQKAAELKKEKGTRGLGFQGPFSFFSSAAFCSEKAWIVGGAEQGLGPNTRLDHSPVLW